MTVVPIPVRTVEHVQTWSMPSNVTVPLDILALHADQVRTAALTVTLMCLYRWIYWRYMHTR